ncbi:MAG: nucleotide exchange factor GrpE [Erysipelotrichaceae bacterium]|nr:nucleotide exchange factor GrpE [Erysipelotrichaceae bacterium]
MKIKEAIMMRDEIKIEDEELNEEEIKDKGEKKAKKKLDEVLEKLAKANADVEHWKNEYYRAYADTKNLRNKLEKDYKESVKYRVEGFVDELLPILDSFESVLKQEVEDPNLKNYLIGFQYVYKNLLAVLENEGVKTFIPKVDDKFDASTMDAIDTIEGEKENIITKVYASGYKLHDHLIRPARVQVSVIKKEEKENKPEENLDA